MDRSGRPTGPGGQGRHWGALRPGKTRRLGNVSRRLSIASNLPLRNLSSSRVRRSPFSGGGGGGGGGDGFAGISGDLVDGRFSEKEAKAIANQNSKLLRVRLGEPFMARQGSMVAYQGNVDFSFEGGGASKFIKKALTGEGLPLMRCSGQGDVFLAERSYDVHLLNVTNSGLSISGKNVLAFSSSLELEHRAGERRQYRDRGPV